MNIPFRNTLSGGAFYKVSSHASNRYSRLYGSVLGVRELQLPDAVFSRLPVQSSPKKGNILDTTPDYAPAWVELEELLH